MDSGRKALLEKARKFGSLAQNMTFQDFLDKSVTYRTLALYLGIQSEWWDEFWRSFSFAIANHTKEKRLTRFHFCFKAGAISRSLRLLSSCFWKGMRIADISEKEFLQAYRLVM